jgi:hypothetical protein
MHSLVALVAILVSFVVFTDSALARRVSIGGTHSIGEIKAKCAAVGGEFFGTRRSGYGCNNDNKGTGVFCDAKGKCTGGVPDRQAPKGGRTGAIGGTTKAMSFGATRIGGTQRTHGTPPTSAAMIQRCWKHHC